MQLCTGEQAEEDGEGELKDLHMRRHAVLGQRNAQVLLDACSKLLREVARTW